MRPRAAALLAALSESFPQERLTVCRAPLYGGHLPARGDHFVTPNDLAKAVKAASCASRAAGLPVIFTNHERSAFTSLITAPSMCWVSPFRRMVWPVKPGFSNGVMLAAG